MGWGGGEKVQEKGTYIYLWLIHTVVQQKPTQYGKAIILQLKILFLKSDTNELIYKTEIDLQTQKTNLCLPKGKNGQGRDKLVVWDKK